MPQMAPIFLLYLFFLVTLLLFMIMNYFIKPYFKIEALQLEYIKTDKDWK